MGIGCATRRSRPSEDFQLNSSRTLVKLRLRQCENMRVRLSSTSCNADVPVMILPVSHEAMMQRDLPHLVL
jgi:hypothetical protein